MADESKEELVVIASTAERMEKIMGGDPAADVAIPDNEPVPAEDLKDVDNVDDDVDDDVDEDSTPDDDKGDVGDDDDSTPEDDDDDLVDKDGDDVDTDDDAHEADEQKDTPQLSDAYHRAAIYSGMSEKDVEDFMVASPELAIKTFAKLHEGMNRASREFSNIGRYKKEQAAKPDNETADNESASNFEKVDLTKLREDFPEDNSLISVIEGMQGQMEKMDSQLKVKSTQPSTELDGEKAKLEAAKVQHISEQINDFFGAPDMQVYADVYGAVPKDAKDWGSLLPSEKMNRVAVIDQVEQLMIGAEELGGNMEVGDALQRAHLLVTEPVREKMIREDIMAKVVKRSKGITLKPSGKASAKAPAGKPKTDGAVEANAAERLAAMKW